MYKHIKGKNNNCKLIVIIRLKIQSHLIKFINKTKIIYKNNMCKTNKYC